MISLCESPQVTLKELLGASNSDTLFVDQLTKSTGFDNAVPFSEGRSALVHALDVAGVTQQDEVLLPGYACYSIIRAVETKATPIVVDVDENTYNIDVQDAANKITPDTKAIVPVHMYGYPCDMSAVSDLAQKHDLTIIEDAAHALGTTAVTDTVGSNSDYCFFSFRFTKELTVFKGGLLLGDNLDEVQPNSKLTDNTFPIQLLSTKIADSLLEQLPGSLYEAVRTSLLDPLFESSSDEITCTEPQSLTQWEHSSLTAQYERLQERVHDRQERAAQYRNRLPKDIEHPPHEKPHSYYRYPIRVPPSFRDEIVQELRQHGVGCSTMYSYTLGPTEACPNAAKLSEEIINLPIHSSVTMSELRHISQVFNWMWDQYGR